MAIIVLRHTSITSLQQLVNQYQSLGYAPVGGLIADSGFTTFSQEMVTAPNPGVPYAIIFDTSISAFQNKATAYRDANPQGLALGALLDNNVYIYQAFGVNRDEKLTRVKSECWFTGLNLSIPNTPTNLITLIKSLSHTGSLAPFFNTTTDKFNVSNFDTSVNFKINLIGTWSGSSTNRSVTVDFPQTNGNSLTKTRDAAVTSDQVSLSSFFSVDKDGNLATNGSDITVKSNGATFTVTAILLIAEQLIPS